MAHRRISFAICYITFNTRFSLKEHMKSEAHLLAPGPAGVKGRFVGEFMLLLDGNSERQRETGFTSVMSVTRISSLCQRITSTRFGSTLAMCVSARLVARSSKPTVASTDTRSFSLWGKDQDWGDYPQSEHDGEEERKKTVLASFRKRTDILHQLHWKSMVLLFREKKFLYLSFFCLYIFF